MVGRVGLPARGQRVLSSRGARGRTRGEYRSS